MRKFLPFFWVTAFLICSIRSAATPVQAAEITNTGHRYHAVPDVLATATGAGGDAVFPGLSDGRGWVQARNADESPAQPGPGPINENQPEQMTFWGWLWDYLYNGASITVGVGTRQSGLKVTRLSNGASGTIVHRDEEAYFLTYSTRPSFLGDSRFGYAFMLGYSTFTMDKQEVAKDTYVDLGTRVRGRVAYVVPTLFYQWGEHRKIGKFVRLGVGAGLGVADFSGDVLLSDGARAPVANGSYDLKFALSAFLEARYRHWGVRISAAGPTYEDETYQYNLSDVAVNLGYSWYF